MGIFNSSYLLLYFKQFSFFSIYLNVLQAWWNRMSNRFRNLKLGRTFTTANRLGPMPLSSATSVQDLTLKGPGTSQVYGWTLLIVRKKMKKDYCNNNCSSYFFVIEIFLYKIVVVSAFFVVSQESCDLKVIVLAVSTYEAQGFGGSRADHNINDQL